MKKTIVKINKSVHLGMSILDISKTLMYDFWYNYVYLSKQSKIMLHEY